MTGSSCRDVAEALALIAALEVQRGMPAAAEAAPAPEPPAWAESDLSGPLEDVPPRGDASQGRDRVRVGVVGFALIQSITAPRTSADLGVGLRVSWQTAALQPQLLLGAHWGGEEIGVDGRGGTARFERWSAYFVGCLWRFPRASAIGVRPCLDVDWGRLTGEGRGVGFASQSSSLLASAGAGLRLQWAILERIELEAMLGGVLTLVRPRFYFEPEYTALAVAPAGLRAGISAGLSF